MTVNSRLEQFFVGAAGKLLSPVEANPHRSNQHEFNGVGKLAELLGAPPEGGRRFAATYLFLDDAGESRAAQSTATWYDARAAHPSRSEFRLYYPDNDVMRAAAPGDFMVLARPREIHAQGNSRELVVIVTPAESSVCVQLLELFGLEQSETLDLEVTPSGQDLNFTSRELLALLGFDAAPADDTAVDQVLEQFPDRFPTTTEFSQFARGTLPDVDPRSEPDAAVLAWMEREEALYRALERHLLVPQFSAATGDVDKILEVAMQTFQRRRSRAGSALENHLAVVFSAHGVAYERQAVTEGRRRPDFLFPGSVAYLDENYPSEQLRMLGVKTTCKDRWRQVLSEADRIEEKHLFTLEAPISLGQVAEMVERQLQLVVPGGLHHVFDPAAQSRLLSLADFVGMLAGNARPA